ncbi:MAG: hypothetical protein M0D57_13070 [Sphingobacteriales bacterium JAD_PAG50586_3]|nr:MAG: hypothetical protein M0D57_13070 [Sphingobacteriales bacterium JAD_PAG50586_3]
MKTLLAFIFLCFITSLNAQVDSYGRRVQHFEFSTFLQIELNVPRGFTLSEPDSLTYGIIKDNDYLLHFTCAEMLKPIDITTAKYVNIKGYNVYYFEDEITTYYYPYSWGMIRFKMEFSRIKAEDMAKADNMYNKFIARCVRKFRKYKDLHWTLDNDLKQQQLNNK